MDVMQFIERIKTPDVIDFSIDCLGVQCALHFLYMFMLSKVNLHVKTGRIQSSIVQSCC